MKIHKVFSQSLDHSLLTVAELSVGIRFCRETGAFLLLFLALSVISCYAQSTIVPYTFTTIAGEVAVDGSGGYADGAGTGAQFNYPEGVAVDKAGNVYVADSVNNVVRELKPSGATWTVTTLAGTPGVSGFADSVTDSSALFNNPQGVAVDSLGNVFVADTGNNRIREVMSGGGVITIAGDASPTNGGYQDGTGLIAQFNFPEGLAIDPDGNLYVSDTDNASIRKVTQPGNTGVWYVSTFAGDQTYGFADGPGLQAEFSDPVNLAVGPDGDVYVADTGNNVIRKITPDGVVSTLAGSPTSNDGFDNYLDGIPFPSQDETGSKAGFFYPFGVALDQQTNVYVTDTYDSEIRKITPDGIVTTLAGVPVFDPTQTIPYPQAAYANGTGSSALFFYPTGIALDANGNVFVSDCDNCVIREGVAPVVQLVALEVTQVIQDWNNSVPLVQGKETFVRAHLQLPSASDNPVMVSAARLYGIGPDGAPLGLPLPAISPNASVNVITTKASSPNTRRDFNQSLNFELPPEWLTGSITLRLDWPGNLTPVNVVPANRSVNVTFIQVGIPQIKFFDVQWTDTSGIHHQLGPSITNLAKRVLSCYPVSGVDATYDTLQIHGQQTPDFGKAPYAFVKSVNEQIADKRNLFVRYHDPGTPFVGNRIYHGGIQADPVYGTNILFPINIDGESVAIPSFVSCATVLGTYGAGRQSVSHEISHNLGNYHDLSSALFGTTTDDTGTYANGACLEHGTLNVVYPLFFPVFEGSSLLKPALGPVANGDNSLIYGLDSFTLINTKFPPVIAPLENNVGDLNCYFDLMSYCRNGGQEDLWPSSYTYGLLISEINDTFPVASPTLEGKGALATVARSPKFPHPSQPQPLDTNVNYLIVRGTVNFTDGIAQFLPCLPWTSTNVPPTETAGTNFLLEGLDGADTVVQAVGFDLQPNIDEGGISSLTANFFVPLTEDPSIRTLQLWHNGLMLATLTAGPNAPSLTLTSPNGGENFSTGPTTISWTGSESGGATLSYTVQYSLDDGLSWETLALDWPDQSFDVDSSQLDATTQGIIRVIASDGFNTTIVQSATTFTVQPHPPIVSIDGPSDGSIFIGDQQLFLKASVVDMQDGSLGITNVQWFSDRDGALGTGTIINFAGRNLSEGHHTITALATDSVGLTNSAVIHLVSLHNPPPQLTLQQNPQTTLSYRTLAWPSYYTNYVLQSSSTLDSGWSTITNKIPQIVGNQNDMIVSVTNQSTFYRLLLK